MERLPIIVALDGMTAIDAAALIDKIGERVWGVKFNDLYHDPNFQWAYAAAVKAEAKIFIDLKLHDIPNTVANTVREVLEQCPDTNIITVHASGGKKMIEAAVGKIAATAKFSPGKLDCDIAGVTVLTSLSDDECESIYGGDREDTVRLFTKYAVNAGAKYIVCSAAELSKFPEGIIPEVIKKIVPGIRTSDYNSADDQAVVGTVTKALEDGADLLVIGRAITKADDPAAAVGVIADEIEKWRNATQLEAVVAIEKARGEIASDFIALALKNKAIQFGQLKLKSGRMSPYFFNSGAFNSGVALNSLGGMFADMIEVIDRSLRLKTTLIAGPAYKGIALAIAAAQYADTGFVYDRKEAKTYGDGGDIIGQKPTASDQVVVVDDVITTGATKVEFVEKMRAYGAKIGYVIVALDRGETVSEDIRVSAVEAFKTGSGLPVYALATIEDLLDFLEDMAENTACNGVSLEHVFASTAECRETIDAIRTYYEQYRP